MQYNRNIVRVKQLLQCDCDANSRDGEQSMNCIFYADSGSVRTGQMNGIVWCVYVTLGIFHRI